jgi:hypothetical protein
LAKEKFMAGNFVAGLLKGLPVADYTIKREIK